MLLPVPEGKNSTCQCTSVCTLEAPGLGTLVTAGIKPKVHGGDSTVLLKCCCAKSTCQCTSVCTLEAPGLGTVVTEEISRKVHGGDSTVLLKCCCQCLGRTSHANAQVPGVWKHRALAPWSPMELFSRFMVVIVLFFSSAVASA